jgi:hypothetical protein
MSQNSSDGTNALRLLKLFNRKAAHLSTLSFPSKAFHKNSGLTMNLQGADMHVEKRGADPEATDAFLLTFRLFLMPRDGFSTYQVTELFPVSDEDKYWIVENLRIVDEFLTGSRSSPSRVTPHLIA